MTGVLFCLLSSNRPIHELLKPVFADQYSALNNQFRGMTNESFTYEMFEYERSPLVKTVLENLSADHKYLLMSVITGQPDWIFADWSKFPGIAWKLKNLDLLKNNNPRKFREQADKLAAILT